MNIKQANLNDVLDVARLALVLWPHHSMHAMALKISETIQENKGAYFLALDKNETIGRHYNGQRFRPSRNERGGKTA